MKKAEDLINESVKEVIDDIAKEKQKTSARRNTSYAARVKQWWNSRLHGQFKKQDIEGAKRVLCVVTAASGATVTQAEGTRTKKRSAKGAARAAAIGKVCASVKAAHGGKRVSVDLAELKFTYEVLEG